VATGSVQTGRSLEAEACSLYMKVDYQGSIRAHEQALAAYRDEGDSLGAARTARILAWLYLNLYGDWALAGGWLARAERLLEHADQGTLERGWVELVRAILEPQGEGRVRRLEMALELGRRLDDPELEFAALSRLGESRVAAGRVEEGMEFLDESLTAVCAGEVQDLEVVESVFCGMFVACEQVQDIARAEQWLRAADELVQRRNQVAIGAFCRAHYGGILTAAGRWDEAEAELGEAARVFEGSYEGSRAMVLARLADLRVRQGRLEEAGVLLEGLDQRADAARPLAALHLARGQTALARDLIERNLAERGLSAAGAGPLLTLLVEVCLAEGRVGDAAESSERLSRLAERHPSPYFEACAALAKGRVCLASRSGDARACLRESLSAFSRAQMPVELAQARLELAKAVADERPEVAVAEAKAALDAFERRKAGRDADAAAALLRSLGAPGRSAPRRREPLTKRESEVLELLGLGLSNPEIAERLVISTKTAEHHVGHILSKLDLRNRAEAAAYATRASGRKPGTE
jgi:ATP/maltotriose-dependent transcriptional regulator MalT